MKHYTFILLAASLSLGVLVPIIAHPAMAQPAKAPATAVASQDDLFKSIQADARAKKYAEVVAQAEEALKIKGLSDKDRYRFLNAAADASSRQSQYAQAQGFYEKIVSDAEIPNNSKIAALKSISDTYITTLAGQYLDQMDLAPAYDALNRALKLPDLKPEEQAIALKNLGALYEREDNYDKAIATYQQIIALDVRDQTKTAAWKMIADAYASSGQADKAVAIYEKNDFDLLKLYNQLGDTDKAVALATKVLDDAAASEKDRWAAFYALPYWSFSYDHVVRRENIAGVWQMSKKYLPAFIKTDPDKALVLLRVINRDTSNTGFVAWAAPLLLQAPKMKDKDYIFVTRKYTDALMALGDVKQATAQAQSIVKDERVDAATHFWAKLVTAGLTGKAADISNVIKQEKALPEKEKAQEVINAGQTVLISGNEEAGRDLYSAYEGLFAHLPTATIDAPFAPDVPFDVGSWMTSPLLKDTKSTAKLDRPYGDNLQFLIETDSSSTGRTAGSASDKSTGDTVTNLHVVSDTQGLHVFFDAHDSRAQEVIDGLIRAGSFEMYLAPGKDQAYYTFLPSLLDGKVYTGPGAFITMYRNSGFRLPSTDDGTLRSIAHRTKDGFGLSIFLSWQLFYDKLPSNGTKWQFESIRWTRAGGLSFAGSQSVHNRSSWGDIIFSGLTPQNLNAIKRSIIFDAVKKYTAAKKITAPVGQWNDNELGDPAFYESQVAPLLTGLDKYVGMVNNDMTAANVETIFNEAVPGWMEIDFKVAALRKQYLKKKFLK